MKHLKPINESEWKEHNEKETQCYVFIQGNDINEDHYYNLVSRSKNDEIILYPERSMTFVDTVQYRPYVKSIVTENPYIISCYDRRDVWVLNDDRWENPNSQTYGCSVNIITMNILNYTNSIPMLPLGGSSFKSKIKKMKNYD